MALSIFEQIDRSGLFQKFPVEIKQQLARMSHRQSLPDGQVLYRSGDEPSALYGVLEGGIKLTGEDSQGKFFLFGIVQPGWWFGEISVLDGEPRAQIASATGATELVHLPRKSLLNLLEEHPQLYRHFIDVLCHRLRQAGIVMEEGAFLSTSLRLAKQLLRLHKSRAAVQTKFSQEELAASLGVTRQSIYRVLKEWQALGWVVVSYGDIEVTEPAKLQALVAGQE